MQAITEVMGVIALVGLFSTIVALAVLHALPTGLSPVRNAVSQYGISNYALGYRVATISLGIAFIASAIGIPQAISDTSRVAIGCLSLAGAGRLVISWFPMDEPGSPFTPTGRRHGLIAIVTFASITAAAFALHSCLAQNGAWTKAHGAFAVISWCLLASVLGTFVVRRTSYARYFGLVERLFYLSTFVFVALVGIELIAHG